MLVLEYVVPAIIPALIILVGVAPAAICVHGWRRFSARTLRSSPLTRDLLRPPGYSLQKRLREVEFEVDMIGTFICFLPLFAYSIHISQSYLFGTIETPLRFVATAVALAAMEGVFFRKFIMQAKKRRKLRAGLDGEQATGEELNQLLRDGCRVFHDVPFPYGNIDHVVVSSSGVSVVETKLIGRGPHTGSQAEVDVDNEKGLIRFPDHVWPIPVAQLDAQARWLVKFLHDSTGDRVPVEAMLAIPGWFIRSRKGRSQILVLNPRNAAKFFVSGRRLLTDEAMQRVSHQLEQLCRDVEPMSRDRLQTSS